MIKVYKNVENGDLYSVEDDIDIVKENGKTYLIVRTLFGILSPIAAKYECGHFNVEKVEVEEVL